MFTDLIDKLAARLAVWSLTRLYGPPCEDFDPDCIGCQANKIIESLKDFKVFLSFIKDNKNE